MMEVNGARKLEVEALRRALDPAALGFGSTAEVRPLETMIGQTRAHEAITFGLATQTAGYNIFATGPVGTGKRTALQAQLLEHARRRPTPKDWVYLHNFRDPRRPIAVALASGRGRQLQADMRRFLEDARRELTAALESDTYARRQREATEPLEREQEADLAKLREQARAVGIALELTPAGIMTVPLRGTHPMTPAEFAELPEAVRARYQASMQQLQPSVQAFVARMRALQREGRDRLRALEREVALFAIGHLIDELKERHGDTPQLGDWLTAVEEDVTENLALFHAAGQEPVGDGVEPAMGMFEGGRGQALARYEVNAFVTHEADGGAPVVVENNPTYPNLFGRIEHQGVLGGGFVTDHRMLRPGAVHRANGGYLMLPATEVLAQPVVWLKLKEVLRGGCIRLENLAEQ